MSVLTVLIPVISAQVEKRIANVSVFLGNVEDNKLRIVLYNSGNAPRQVGSKLTCRTELFPMEDAADDREIFVEFTEIDSSSLEGNSTFPAIFPGQVINVDFEVSKIIYRDKEKYPELRTQHDDIVRSGECYLGNEVVYGIIDGSLIDSFEHIIFGSVPFVHALQFMKLLGDHDELVTRLGEE